MFLNKLFITVFIIFSVQLDAKSLWHMKSDSEKMSNSVIQRASNGFVELAKETSPTVVNIYTTVVMNNRSQGFYGRGTPEDLFNLFDQLFGQGGFSIPRTQKATALGTGFIINPDGYILTNNHVVMDADEIMVKLLNGDSYKAKLIGSDPQTDIALIKIESDKELPYAYLGDSSKTEVGEWVIAIGNPLGHSHTVTSGIVSAKGRLMPEVSVYSDFIQTDASINPGNSGGPLINTAGEVIGINTAINRQAQGVAIEGIGFAIPIDEAKNVLPQLAKGVTVAHSSGWLGVGMDIVTPQIAEYFNYDISEGGVIITEVVPGSPAEKAGLKKYDIITNYNGKSVKTPGDLVVLVKRSHPDRVYKIKIFRNGKTKTLDVHVAKRDEAVVNKYSGKQQKKKQYQEGNVAAFGLYVEDLTKESINNYRLKNVRPYEGVIIVQIESGSSAARAGLSIGDIIMEVNKTRVRNKNDFIKALKTKNNLLQIQRGDHSLVLMLK